MNETCLASNLIEALQRAARTHPGKGIAMFDGRGRRVDRRSFAELWELACDRAARFRAAGITEREPVLVAFPTSWEWLESWFGLLVCGAWPVATSAAGAMAAASAQLDKVEKVMERIGAAHVIATEAFRDGAREQGFPRAADAVLSIETLRTTAPASSFTPPRPAPEDTAFLQLTSGSTGLPRAVTISHGAALHNPVASSEAIGAPFGQPVHEWADAMVSWLPLYHDMGLIGCLILPIITGVDTWLMRPQTFLARPRLWLEQLGAQGRTFVPSPNFGYQLCVERIATEKANGLDLSQWRAALTGAEMIRTETTTAFCERFAASGFDPAAFRPCYGLAEGTLAVTFDVRGQGVRSRELPKDADQGFGLSKVVSTGEAIRDTRVEVVSQTGRALPDGCIGEVRFRGPGLFSGYHNDPGATAETIRDGWFHTGDLGFMSDGELYLTGRTKELLIVGGQNLMPDELERLADQVTGGGGLMRSAAFSVARGAEGEQAVLVVELKDSAPSELDAVEQQIRSSIGRTLGLPLADLVFVRRGRIPRTTSGKMQRGELRRQYLEDALETIDS